MVFLVRNNIVLSVLAAVAFSGSALADAAFVPSSQLFPPTVLPQGEVVSDDKPVLLTADEIEYQQNEETVVARGKVEVAQGETLLLADRLVYNKRTGIVNAVGNVSIMDETGSVIFADEAELMDDMRRGVIEEFKVRMNDDSLFAAARANKVSEDVLEMERVLYSPCKVKCAEDLKPGESPRDPLWQLRAEQVTIDQKAQDVTYKNAQMELFGLPVLYTPYMSHAMPNSPGRSGILFPEYERDHNLGSIYRLPVYYAIAPDRDLLLTPMHSSKEGALLRGLYTQQFDTGRIRVDASTTRPRQRDAAGNRVAGHEWRGHTFAEGKFDVEADTVVGFDIKRTTDDTYLRKYKIDGATMLPSRLYAEKYDFTDPGSRSALTADALAFQGLAATDDSQRIPLALPLVNFDYETAPTGFGARYFLNSNALALSRDIGANSRRLSNTIGVRVPYISHNGQVIELTSQLRGDVYHVSDVSLAGRSSLYSGMTGRVIPEVSALWRYPLINQISRTNIMVEPVISVAASPNGGNPDKIPNEDSLVPEFTDTNLFSPNRFAGYDRVEQGVRASYGMRGVVNYRQSYVDWLIGQHFRSQEDRSFPFSNDPSDDLSDYVGKVGVQLYPFYLAYRFRMDKESLDQKRKELDLRYSSERGSATLTYVSLENDPVFASREEIVGNMRVNVSKNWEVAFGARKDLLIDQVTNVGGELVFKNECVNIAGVVNREYTRDREIKPDTSYLVRFSLKNLN